MTSEVAIIGLGPAGISCAIQLLRYGMQINTFEKDSIGGLLKNANLVENYPGFPSGISGQRLTSLMKDQLLKYNIKPVYEEVQSLDWCNNRFVLETKKTSYTSERCVLSCGTKAIPIKDIEIDDKAWDKIYYEVHSLRDIRGKRIVVIGSGDAAYDYAMNLAKNNKVKIFSRSDSIKCLPLLEKRANENINIIIEKNVKIKKIKEKDNCLYLNCNSLETQFEQKADFVLFAIGRKPAFIRLSAISSNEYDKLIDDRKLFEIGDFKNGIFRQTAISCGDGLRAAMTIYNEKVKYR